MVQFQLKKLYIGLIFLFLSISVYSQGPPRLRFTQLPQSDSIGSLLLTNSQKNLEFTNNLRYLNNVFSVVGDANFDDNTLYVDATNNRVGIGTVSPSVKLHIEGGNIFAKKGSSSILFDEYNNGSILWMDGSDGDVTGGDYWGVYAQSSTLWGVNYAGGNNILNITSSGNVGIGTDAITGKLHIVGNTPGPEYRGFIYTNNSSATLTNESLFQAVAAGYSSNSPIFLFRDDRSDQQTTQRIFELQGARSGVGTILTTLANGNVGIGTSTPNAKLAIKDGSNTDLELFSESSGTALQSYNRTTSTWGYLRFLAGGGEKMRIHTDGNVGIGTTNPLAKLDVRGRTNVWGGGTTSGTLGFSVLDLGSNYNFYVEDDGGAYLRGNVRIGNSTNNGYKLDVNGTGRFSNTLTASSTAGGTSAIFQNTGAQNSNGIELRGGTAGTSVNWKIEKDNTVGNAFQITPSTTNGGTTYTTPSLTIASTGAATFSNNVGIGQLNPNAPLHVVGRAIASNFVVGPYSSLNDATGIANTLQFGNYAIASFIDQNSADAYVYKASSSVSGMAPQTLMFQTRSDVDGGGFAFVSGNTPTAKMYIEGSSGNVGIGTTSPSAKLDVDGGIRLSESGNLSGRGYPYTTTVGSGADATTTYIEAGSTSGYQSRITVAGGGAATDPNTIKFSVASNESMRIDANGNVGIGTTSPDYKLDVNGGIKLNGKSALTDDAYFVGAPNYGFRWNSVDNLYNNVIMYDNGNMYVRGNVGIGTTSPSYKLHVNGSVAGVGAYNNLSDVNYKKNINDLELGLDIVKQLRPITYNWINEEYGTRTNIGFIAQEVESVLPNIVTTADDNVKSMATTDLIPILTKAIQEQQTIIETQEQKIQELETLLQTLVSRIETLENK
jgi:hypothetical protein